MYVLIKFKKQIAIGLYKMKLQNSITFFILDNPFIEKSYQKLLEYYITNKMNYEADCLSYLIINKFSNVNNADTSEK